MVSITQLVECQIVALKVSGSSPGIYPNEDMEYKSQAFSVK